MTKIARKTQKVFANNSGISTNVVAQFGSLKNGVPVYSSDPDIIQALPAWAGGWAGAMIANGSPSIQDLNGLLFVISRQLAYVMQNGISEWDSATVYYIGSIVSSSEIPGALFVPLADSNSSAITDGTKWLNVFSSHITDITDSGLENYAYNVLNTDWCVRFTSSRVTGSSYVYLPAATAAFSSREIIIKYGYTIPANDSVLEIAVAGGGLIDGSVSAIGLYPSASRKFICDGTHWLLVSGIF